MKPKFKGGDLIQGDEPTFKPVYVVAADKNKLKLLFRDGSCGWHNICSRDKISNVDWPNDEIKRTVCSAIGKKDFEGKPWIDNLDVVEILNQINARTKSK